MLAYVLALAVGLGSLAIYLAAFFFPEIHRKNDFIWSGVGFFYALVLWVFARRITGGLLLGHVASVALLGWSITQTLSLRRQVTPKTQQTPIPSPEALANTIENQASNISLPQRLSQIPKGIGGVFSGVKDKAQQTLSKKTPQTTSAPTSKSPLEVVDKRSPIPEQTVTTPTSSDITTEQAVTTDTEAKNEIVPQAIPPNPPAPELVEAAKEAAAAEEAAVTELAKTPVEEIAPDAVLAPPAEEPTDKQQPRN
ncbi:hypothetical protein H6G81_25235 [Scytonema hofmannii FACHB-248]|uniref:Ycf66 family protein n=1 Tax=Scytonema hofmannii FACHB-248 TaxID=1842502 RepID=A0ABR8GW50_9CYAN|nr:MULTISPECIES: Ycf66 family protein [Nostocales]MBD2607742.1 hypothetical protein [Scytonema hofmannii FACHB-248]